MQIREAHHSIKHHLISLPVFDLVVQILRQVQALVNVLLKADGALQEERVGDDKTWNNNYLLS